MRCSSPDPVPHELDLRVAQVRAALRHAVAGDAGAGDLPVEIRVGGIERRDAAEPRHLDARVVHGLAVALRGGEDLVRLPSDEVMAAELRAGGGEDLVLHAREGGGRVDRIAAAVEWGGRLLQLAARHDD